ICYCCSTTSERDPIITPADKKSHPTDVCSLLQNSTQRRRNQSSSGTPQQHHERRPIHPRSGFGLPEGIVEGICGVRAHTIPKFQGSSRQERPTASVWVHVDSFGLDP